jgi:disulfide bond formation protein DsbB
MILKAMRAHRRVLSATAALACLLMLCFALFLQYHQGLTPCPLCIFQRIAVFGLAVAFALAALVPDRQRALRFAASIVIFLAAAAGAGVSARHLYIQSLPPGEVPACGATLDYMWEVFPAMQVLRKVLTGSGECAKIDWTLLGLSMPAWVLISVVLLAVFGLLLNWPARGREA